MSDSAGRASRPQCVGGPALRPLACRAKREWGIQDTRRPASELSGIVVERRRTWQKSGRRITRRGSDVRHLAFEVPRPVVSATGHFSRGRPPLYANYLLQDLSAPVAHCHAV